jgi:hypothetical protein
MAIYSVRLVRLHQHLLQRARSAGASVRDRSEAVGFAAEDDGWRIELSHGEPIQAPILIVADGARSSTLEALGISSAQRFSGPGSAAEVLSFAIGHWGVGEAKASTLDALQILETDGPLGRFEVLPGKDAVSVAFGPIWRGPDQSDTSWQSGFAGAVGGLQLLEAKLGLTTSPQTTEVLEHRIDALSSPPTFDGGIVIGAAAGRCPRSPLTSIGAVMRAGNAAGAAAAASTLAKAYAAGDLAKNLGPADAEIHSALCAELAFEAHGLRHPRPLPRSYWRRGALGRGSSSSWRRRSE